MSVFFSPVGQVFSDPPFCASIQPYVLNKSTFTCYYYVPATTPPAPVALQVNCTGATFSSADHTSCLPCASGVASCASLSNATSCSSPDTSILSGVSPYHQLLIPSPTLIRFRFKAVNAPLAPPYSQDHTPAPPRVPPCAKGF